MPRALSPLELQLRTAHTYDVPARQAALIALDNMKGAATRAGVLLTSARKAMMEEMSGNPSVKKGTAAVIAQQAYDSAMSAEVARYRAAFAILAEEQGNEYTKYSTAAAQTVAAQQKQPLVQKANFHGKQRDLLMQAADATGEALRTLPPLPFNITGQLRTNQTVAQGGGEEMFAQPSFGWRPKVFTDLTGNFFPADVKRAAGGLQGGLGGIGSLGMVGAAALGTADATTGYPTADSWWISLQKAFGYGLDAAGKAAAAEGNKKLNNDPSTAGALQNTGGVLSTLSHLFTGSVNEGMQQPPIQSSVDWGTVVLVGGVAAIGGWLVWHHLH